MDVELVLPGTIDGWRVFHAGRGHHARLLRAVVRIHEHRDVILLAPSEEITRAHRARRPLHQRLLEVFSEFRACRLGA